MNSSIKPIAVTISGFIIGRLLTCSIRFCTIFFDFDRPIAEIVPTTVEIAVAIRAILNVVYRDSIIVCDSIICRYQRRENPEKLVSDFPLLNEKMTIYTIGR